MDVTVWLSFVGASFVFGLIPGPSVCFTIAHALQHGTRRTMPTILGQLAANCSQIIIVLFGLAKILEQHSIFFHGLKIIGAAYLLYLGYRQWTAREPHLKLTNGDKTKTVFRAFINGFVVCGTNPKAIFYYAALLPQFVVPRYDMDKQLYILAFTSLMIAALVLCFYTVLAGRARFWFQSERHWRVQSRLTGILMMGAGVVLSITS